MEGVKARLAGAPSFFRLREKAELAPVIPRTFCWICRLEGCGQLRSCDQRDLSPSDLILAQIQPLTIVSPPRRMSRFVFR